VAAMQVSVLAHRISLGQDVRLIPPQYVEPFGKRSKNDHTDAEAICEAAGRPGIHFVPIKSVAQQAGAMVLKLRETQVGQRTQLVNALLEVAIESVGQTFNVVDGIWGIAMPQQQLIWSSAASLPRWRLRRSEHP
jgi:hypothetical protein